MTPRGVAPRAGVTHKCVKAPAGRSAGAFACRVSCMSRRLSYVEWRAGQGGWEAMWGAWSGGPRAAPGGLNMPASGHSCHGEGDFDVRGSAFGVRERLRGRPAAGWRRHSGSIRSGIGQEVAAVAWRTVRGIPAGVWRTARWIPAVAFGALWWWGLLRLAFSPDAGAFEGAVAAGGWGLSLLPVHAVPKSRAAGAVGSVRPGGTSAGTIRPPGASVGAAGAGGASVGGAGRGGTSAGEMRSAGAGGGWLTRAWRRRRSGGGSGLS